MRAFARLSISWCVLFILGGFSVHGDDLLRHPFHYKFEGRTLHLHLKTDQVAIFVRSLETSRDSVLPLTLLERFAADEELSIEEAVVTDYPGLVFVPTSRPLRSEELIEALERLEADGGVAFASPVLRHRETLQIPRPEMLITLERERSSEVIDELLSRDDLEWLCEYPGASPLHHFRFKGSVAAMFSTMLELAHDPRIKAAEPNCILRAPRFAIPNDPLFSGQWAHRNFGQLNGIAGADVGSTVAWDLQTGMANITIAILDEGVDVDHPDLAAHIVPGHESTSQPSPEGIPGNADVDPHGTACAGVAAAVGNNGIGVAGAAWTASIQPIRVGFGEHWTETAWLIDGITWAVDNGADILSNSWGGGTPFVGVQNAIQYAHQTGRGGLGSVVLFAAGNTDSAIEFPAALPESIAIGATSPCDERKTPTSCDGEIVWGSNFGPELDLVAPGVLMATTDIVGADGFSPVSYIPNFNGTSAATPLVAGAVALVLTVDPLLTEAQVRSILINGAADMVGDPGEDLPGFDIHMGWGRLDVPGTLSLVSSSNSVSQLNCVESAPGEVTLTWVNATVYDFIDVRQGGLLLDSLPGTATSTTIPDLARGASTLTLQGVIAGTNTIAIDCTVVVVGNSTDLIFAPAAGPVAGGPLLAQALTQNGLTAVVINSLSLISDLNRFSRIWINLGVFPNTVELRESDGARLVDYLSDGIGGQFVYMEGGDTWFFDFPTTLHPLFGVEAIGDGADVGDLNAVVGTGQGICNLTGINLLYAGENRWIDRLEAIAPTAFVVQSNTLPAYNTTVFNDTLTYRTIAASFELGGFADGLLTRADLADSFLRCASDVFVPPVNNFLCEKLGDDIRLTWMSPVLVQTFDIDRNGVPIATLPNASISFLDTAVPAGVHTYGIRAVIGNSLSTTENCTVTVPPKPITGLTCLENSGEVTIDFIPGESYALVQIFRDGSLVTILPGSVTNFTDLSPPGGLREYTVVGVAGGLETTASCSVAVSPDPVTINSCTHQAGGTQLDWTNTEGYDEIEILREGVSIATLGGTAVIYLDPAPGPGNHQYSIVARLVGLDSLPASCVGSIPPDAPTMASCVDGSQSVSISWTNPATYSSIELRRDGILLVTLLGTATSHVDNLATIGLHNYSVRGIFDGAGSSDSTCVGAALPPTPNNFSCVGEVNQATLNWINPQDYSEIEIRRDGAVIANLLGNSTSFVDTTPPVGAVSYEILGRIIGLDSMIATCSTTIQLSAVSNLTCSRQGADVALAWSNTGSYDTIGVYRGGNLLQEIPGNEMSYTDLDPPGGPQTYSVLASLGSIDAMNVTCTVAVPPTAVAGLTCAIANPCTGDTLLNWTNVEAADQLELRLNGILLSTIPGSLSSITTPLTGAGTFELCIRPVIGGVFGDSACCSVEYSPIPSDQIGPLSCTVDMAACTVEVAWAPVQDALSLLVSVNGVFVQSLPSAATSVMVSLPSTFDPAEISISGLNLCGDSITPSSCIVVCQSDQTFVRGDTNGDGEFNVSDCVTTILFLFSTGTSQCDLAHDVNDDDLLNIADVIVALDGIFGQGPLPAAPFPACGDDNTPGALNCVIFPGCP